MDTRALYKDYIKRVVDFTAATLGLTILSPLLIGIAFLIKREDGGRVFFKQERVGKNWSLFKIYKFRTMVEGADKLGPNITKGDDPRITKIGRLLRKYKLDELPQLINVVRGEMSLVGPRPELLKYAKAYEKDYNEILKVKPGITDYASIEYRDENEILRGVENPEEVYLNEILPEKIKHYKRYIKEISFITDLKLILMTLYKLAR